MAADTEAISRTAARADPTRLRPAGRYPVSLSLAPCLGLRAGIACAPLPLGSMTEQPNTSTRSNRHKRLDALLARKQALADALAAARAELERQNRRDHKWLFFVVGELTLRHRPDIAAALLAHLSPSQKEKATRLLAARRDSTRVDGNQS